MPTAAKSDALVGTGEGRRCLYSLGAAVVILSPLVVLFLLGPDITGSAGRGRRDAQRASAAGEYRILDPEDATGHEELRLARRLFLSRHHYSIEGPENAAWKNDEEYVRGFNRAMEFALEADYFPPWQDRYERCKADARERRAAVEAELKAARESRR